MKLQTSFLLLFLLFARNIAYSQCIAAKSFESNRHKVKTYAITNEEFSDGPKNVIRISIIDKQNLSKWYLVYFIEGDEEYLLSEYETNPQVNISYSYYAGIKEVDIDQFAFEKKREIKDVKTGFYPQNYLETTLEDGTVLYMAFTRTEKDTINIRSKLYKK